MKKEDTKHKILERALELFSVKGYDAVSVGEIAEAVGIKAPSLYNHYPSKQAIFDALVTETSKRYEAYAEGLDIHMRDAGKDTAFFSNVTEEALVEKVRRIFVYSLHNETISRFRRMMTIEQFRLHSLSALYSARYVDRMVKYHAEIFDRLIQNGVIKSENAETLSLLYVSPIITLLGTCDREPERENECLEKLSAHVRLFFRTFNVKTAKK